MNKKYQIAVIGSAGAEEYRNTPSKNIYRFAYRTGSLLAKNNCIVITGGKGGVMEQACKGAKKANGVTVGVVNGKTRFTANKFVDVEVVSGMEGCGEESTLILMSDGIICIGGGAGTLQELSIAYRNSKPTVLIYTVPGWSRTLANSFLDSRRTIKFLSAPNPQKAVKILLSILSEQK